MASQTKVIKLFTSDSIHRVKENPTTFKALQDLLTIILGDGPFCVSYKDDEGDMILISNDMGLNEAYDSTEEKLLKLYVKKQGEQSVYVQTPRNSTCEVQKPAEVSQEIVQENQEDDEFKIFDGSHQLEQQYYPEEQCELKPIEVQEQETEELNEKNPQIGEEQKQDPETEQQKINKKKLKKDKRIQQLQELKSTKQDLKGTIKQLKQQIKQSEKENKQIIKESEKQKKNIQKQIKQEITQQKVQEKQIDQECNDQEWQGQFDQNQQFPQFHPGQFGGMRRGGSFRGGPFRGGRFRGGPMGCHPQFHGDHDSCHPQDPHGPHGGHHGPRGHRFMWGHKMMLEKHIRPEFDRMTKVLLQELKNAQLKGPYEGDANPVIHDNITCDSCFIYPIVGVRYKCSVCDNFDLCMKCELEVIHPHPFLKIKDPSQAPKSIKVALNENKEEEYQKQLAQQFQCYETQFDIDQQTTTSLTSMQTEPKQAKGKLKAKLIDHITCPKDSQVLPGQTILKTWQVKNIGKIQWPQNTTLVLVKGNLEVQPCLIPPLQPEEEGAISMKLTIPNLEGKFKGHYKFMTPRGDTFGKKLIVKVISKFESKLEKQKSQAQQQEVPKEEQQEPVIEQEKQKQEEPEMKAAPVQKSKLDQQIDNVMQLGFEDREAIKQLIEKHKGNLDLVVNELFNGQ